MRRAFSRTLGLSAVVLVCACDAKVSTVVEPLENATPLTVSLQTAYPSPPVKPSLSVLAAPSAILVSWELMSAPCLIATASAAQSGSVVEIQIQRSGDPLANCACILLQARLRSS